MSWLARLVSLDRLLDGASWLWRPQPFKEPEPAWSARLPGLARRLLALDDNEVSALSDDPAPVQQWLAEACPELAELTELAQVGPCSPGGAGWERDSRIEWGVPGRKQAQIEAFAAAVGKPEAELLEWCAGKGHLGRVMAHRWGRPVMSLEIDATLCAEGRALASRARQPQDFACVDVLSRAAQSEPRGHVLALHACGDLHRELVRRGSASRLVALDLAPCCYHKLLAGGEYRSFNPGLALRLTEADLRLAVTETVTAPAREQREVARQMAWRLGFDAMRRAAGMAEYRPFKPVPRGWFGGSFEDFVTAMAMREGVPIPLPADWTGWKAQGWARRHAVLRLGLVRHAFRRALELWLVADMAAYLERAGYSVEVGTFCDRRLTPRNLLLSARRRPTPGNSVPENP